MGETKGEDRKYRISKGLLAVFAVLIILALAAAVYIVPRYGKVFAAYKEQRQIYNAAKEDLNKVETKNQELHEKIDKLESAKTEAEAVKSEALAMAAQLEQDILAGKTDKKICYITLDDGPYNRGKDYLELFNKYDIKATFFLTTANGDKLPDQGDLTARSMYPEYLKYGHTIGNHSYSHDYGEGGIYKSAKSFMAAIEKQEQFTKDAAAGYTPNIVRFPGGTSMAGDNLEVIQKALRDAGYGWVDWTVDSGDSGGEATAKADLIKKKIIKASKDPDQKIMVALFHEWSKESYKAMPEIIETLSNEGYVFLPLFYDSVMVNK